MSCQGKKNTVRVEKEWVEKTEQVLLFALKHPAMKQSEIAEKTGVGQSFVSKSFTPMVKIIRLLMLSENEKLTAAQLKKFITEQINQLKRQRPNPTAKLQTQKGIK